MLEELFWLAVLKRRNLEFVRFQVVIGQVLTHLDLDDVTLAHMFCFFLD